VSEREIGRHFLKGMFMTTRRQFTGSEKIQILRLHLLERTDRHQLSANRPMDRHYPGDVLLFVQDLDGFSRFLANGHPRSKDGRADLRRPEAKLQAARAARRTPRNPTSECRCVTSCRKGPMESATAIPPRTSRRQALARRRPRRPCVAADLPGRGMRTPLGTREPPSTARGEARGERPNTTDRSPG
jgi:hypothetical protein